MVVLLYIAALPTHMRDCGPCTRQHSRHNQQLVGRPPAVGRLPVTAGRGGGPGGLSSETQDPSVLSTRWGKARSTSNVCTVLFSTMLIKCRIVEAMFGFLSGVTGLLM